MKTILMAAMVGLVASILITPLVVKYFRREGFGQEIREDGPQTHLVKRGTPTMGGVAIIGSTLLAYVIAHIAGSFRHPAGGPTASGLLLLGLMLGCGGVGFLDDLIKLRRRRNLGLRARAKFLGQLIVALAFGIAAMNFHDRHGLTPASTHISYVRDLTYGIGTVGFVFLAYLIITATTNAVNLTDGMDGLVAGSAAMVMGSYAVITFLQFRASCTLPRSLAGCYTVRDPQDLAIIAAAAMGACFGFLWWNASPAQIFMGDTGSMALGGLMAGLAILSRTELLLVVLGGLFAVVTLSSIIQTGWFKLTRIRTGTGRRVFRMAPFHHHFELGGWEEVTTIVRFWIVGGVAVAFGLGLFYAEYISYG